MTPLETASQHPTGGSSDGAEDISFSPVKERRIRRQIWWVAVASAGVCFFGAASAVSIIALSPAGYVLVGWFMLSLILAFNAGAEIMVAFRDERDKARNERRTLIRLVAVRNGRREGAADGNMSWGYSSPSAIVHRINPKGRR